MNIVPNSPDDFTDETPTLYREGSDYYRTARAQHPNSRNLCLVQSVDRIAQYSSYDLIDLIAPRPLLMIAGTEADTRYFSELAIGKASEPKELCLIEGASHIDLYDKAEYVRPATEKLEAFFSRKPLRAQRSGPTPALGATLNLGNLVAAHSAGLVAPIAAADHPTV